MDRSVRTLLAAASIAAAAGCAQAPQIGLKPEMQAQMRSIAVLDVPEPREHIVFNVTGAPGIFGLLGGIAHSIDIQRKTDDFTSAMKGRKLAVGAEITNALQVSLEARGFDVQRLQGVRPGVKDGNLADFSTVKTDADAILNVLIFSAGYLSPASSTDYHPWVRVFARMVSAKPPHEIIYFQVFNYGAQLGASETVINLSAPAGKFLYGSFEDLMRGGGEAASGLLGAARPIAEGIAGQLRPGAPGPTPDHAPPLRPERGPTTLDDLKDLLPKK